jgi:hypothetical protein
MVKLDVSIAHLLRRRDMSKNKKADALKHPEAFDHIGLLISGPPGIAELPYS